MFTLATAGHIDHGKSSLIKALTTIDPDRLPEEKERGMTIDLGFAWLELPSGEIVGMVDVPGHKQFVHHVVPGLFAIDAVLLVVAADDGWMPQTEEHLQILDLLGIKNGIIVLNKIDLASDAEWLDLVEKDIIQHLANTGLSGSPVIRVSARTGQGIDELKKAIAGLTTTLTPRQDIGKPRLAVDRVFTIKGSGVVVTGTLSQGIFSNNDEVTLLPSGIGAHIRGIESYKQMLGKAQPGSRVALNLSGLKREDIKRGDIIIQFRQKAVINRMVNAEIKLLPTLETPLKNMAEVLVYMETRELLARVVPLGTKAIKPGEMVMAQLRFSEDVASFIGERFIIRQQSPTMTIGGGVVLEPDAGKFKLADASKTQAFLERRKSLKLEDLIFSEVEKHDYVEDRGLLAVSLFSQREINAMVKALINQKKLVLAAAYLVTPLTWQEWSQRLLNWLQKEHENDKLKKGASQAAAQVALGLPKDIFDVLVSQVASTGKLVREEDTLYLAQHKPRLSQQQEALVAVILKLFQKNSSTPPSLKDISTEFANSTDVVRYMLQQGLLVELPDGILLEAKQFQSIQGEVIKILKEKGKISIQDISASFGFSRKYSVPLLTHLDRLSITRREGDVRIAGKKLP
jgi:selenocysteine-specific elongation factor